MGFGVPIVNGYVGHCVTGQKIFLKKIELLIWIFSKFRNTKKWREHLSGKETGIIIYGIY